MSSQGGPESEPALSLRITHITTTMATPLPSLRSLYVPSTLPTAVPPGLNPSAMPVIRIFGTTTAQQKICANVHMCYPYFYVPFPMDSIDPLRPERVVKLCQRFAVSLNHALCLALRQNPSGKSAAANFAGGTDTKHLHVVSVLLVKGIPFYGYHIGYSYFLRVTLANPKRLHLAMEQLRKPVVLGREWQPHEAHLSHVLQFMCDFDLYGCGILNLSGGKFRGPLPVDDEESEGLPGRITESTAPAHMLYPVGTEPSKDTHSTLEIDVLPHQIMNRNRLEERPLHQDFIELLHQPLHPEEKLVPAMKELWEDERRRRIAKGLGTSEIAMLPVSGGGRGRTMEELGYKVEGKDVDNRGGDWKISEELWELLQDRMDIEKKRRGTLTFDRLSRDLANGKEGERKIYDKWIMTTFEAVTSHWPKTARTQRTQRSVRSAATVRGASSPGAPSSSPPPPTSPIPEDDDEEANPFDIAATQAASQGAPLEAEVDADAVAADVSEEPETNDEQVLHEETARLHARQSQQFRATQRVIDEFELDDEALDELFRQTVPAQNTTPKRDRYSTPTSAPPSTIKKESRVRRAAEEAGFADLNSIDMSSSFALSSPTNPYAGPQTPTRQKSVTTAQVTLPSSLVRNIFARSRSSVSASPIQSPSKKRISPNTVMLPQPKRSFVRLSPTPQPGSQAPQASSSPLIPAKRPIRVLSEIKARSIEIPATPLPNGQGTPALPKQVKPALTPTFVDPDVFGSTPITRSKKRATVSTASDSASTPATGRTKKRVKISSAEDSASQEVTPRNPSQVVPSNSTAAETSVQSSGSKAGLSSTAWTFREPPPSRGAIADTMEENGVDSVVYQDPFYSNPADVPLRPKLFAGRLFNVKGNGVADLQDFQVSIATPRPWLKSRRFLPATARHGWEYGPPPPTRREVLKYFGQGEAKPTQPLKRKSQLAVPTQKNKYGYKLSQKKPQREGRNMSVLCLEVFAPSRGQLLPDPEKDEIEAIFYCFQNDDESLLDSTIHSGYHAGYVIIDGPQTTSRRATLDGIPVTYVESELDLINWVIDTTREWDPDVLTGWELHNSSWGYVSARADKGFSMDLMNEISRMLGGGGFNRKDGYSAHHTSTFKVEGRHVLNIWRILRSEVTLNQYTFEHVVFHVLHQRIPRYSAGNLTALWRSKTPGHTALVLRYMFQRVVIYAELLDASEIVSKNAEFARVFGVDFDAVIFRGSQFKVESFIFRLAKPESFVMVSPSKQQVGLQNAPFATPLIAEPESKYYNHPIVVLDFQSLYPSVMIAYNICYSTCLGRVEKFKGTDKFGFTELKVADGMIELLKDYLTVTPNGMIFVKPAVRKSLLAKMLGEVLDTRVMVKNAMKGARGDKSLTQMLNARQLGLKLMANVTYGYTSATFSGRMPCIEIADSIVQTGRETLEKAQELIHSRADWNATVVYGDTDSLFISLPGRSKEQAFKIGHDIADTVTAMNPKPVKLKFEKVYMGSVLMAKKRYVGFKYEHPDETEPVFDAKGIETIRRDGFAAQQKMEEVCLKMLFRNQDLSEIKDFCRQEWTKILQGRVSPQDFIIAKEVRLGTYSEKGIPPPGAAVAYRRILKDPRDEPQYAERVPYVISNAEGRRLIDRARMPEEMLANRSLGIDAEYYIRNLLIPPLARIFNLVGADVEQWYDSMPRQKRAGKYGALGGMRIDSHFLSAHCLVCGGEGGQVCDECRHAPAESAEALLRAEHDAQARLIDLQRICASCSGTPAGERLLCDSVDCPVMYTRVAAERDAQDTGRARELVSQLDW